MKNIYTLFTALIILGLFPFFFTTKTEAATFVSESYTLEKDDIVEDDLYATGEEIVINGIIDGDLFVSGISVKIDGTITGDLYVGAQAFELEGNVHGNVFSMAQYSTVPGIVGKSFFNISQMINYEGETGEDLLSISASASMEGSIGDDLRLLAGQSDITSLINGDAIVSSATSSIDEDKITGTYYDDADLNKFFGVEETVIIEEEISNLHFNAFNTSVSIFGFIGMYIVGSILITLMPAKSFQIKQNITRSTSDFFKSMLIGFGVFTLIPLPLFLLMISIVGFPLSTIVFGFLMFMVIFGKLWVEMAFGEEILELLGFEKRNYYLSLLTGRTLSLIISFVPVLRFFYGCILTFTAMGAVVRMKLTNIEKAKTQPKKATKRVAKKVSPKKKRTAKK